MPKHTPRTYPTGGTSKLLEVRRASNGGKKTDLMGRSSTGRAPGC